MEKKAIFREKKNRKTYKKAYRTTKYHIQIPLSFQ